MSLLERFQKGPYARITLYAVLLLFFFQLIWDFVEAIYAFGLMGTDIPVEIVSVLFLFTPLFLLLWRGQLSLRSLTVFGMLMIISRLMEVMLSTRGRMIVSGIGVGAFMMLFPALLSRRAQAESDDAALDFSAGLMVAVSLSALFRGVNSGIDISTVGMFQIIGWFLALVAAWLLMKQPGDTAAANREADHRSNQSKPAKGGLTSLSLGITAIFIFVFFAFGAPNVIARWAGLDLLWVEITFMAAAALTAWGMSQPRILARMQDVQLLRAVNISFMVLLMLAILPHQIQFPGAASGYPLSEPTINWIHLLPLFLMLVLSPVLFLNLSAFSRALIALKPTARSLGGSFSLASLFWLFLILAHISTTVYDYLPVIGPPFRDRFWLVFLIAGAAMLAPLWRRDMPKSQIHTPLKKAVPALVTILALAAVGGVMLRTASPAEADSETRKLRLLTYNIQQGYSEDGLKNFDGQLELIRSLDADVIGLQESDTNRIAGGNSDVVGYFADRLNMHAYYGPSVIPGTFGIALLSKYPIESPRTFYMFSEGEQTAAIHAQISVGGKRLNLFVTHLGNGGPIVQQEAIMEVVGEYQDVLLMGDFNFRPDTEQYQMTTAVLDDAWLLQWPEGVDSQGLNPDRRIDHFFVSPGTRVNDARHLISPQSDHPAVLIEVEW